MLLINVGKVFKKRHPYWFFFNLVEKSFIFPT